MLKHEKKLLIENYFRDFFITFAPVFEIVVLLYRSTIHVMKGFFKSKEWGHTARRKLK